MTSSERATKLTQATALLVEVEASLDKTGTECSSCHRMHYANWDEHLSAKELRNMIDKLRKQTLLAVPKFQPEPPPPQARKHNQPLNSTLTRSA